MVGHFRTILSLFILGTFPLIVGMLKSAKRLCTSDAIHTHMVAIWKGRRTIMAVASTIPETNQGQC